MRVTEQSAENTAVTESGIAAIESPAAVSTKVARERRAVPKWESDARTRLRAAIQRFSKPLAELANRDANEGDTRLFITDFLCDALGFDKYAELTTEYQVRGEFADYGIRLDKDLVAFIEVKRISTKLSIRHLRQVEMYAVNEGVEWMILTNGAVWQVWHLSPGMPVVLDMVFEIDLLSSATAQTKTNELFHISREAMRRNQLDELWKARSATSARAVAAVLRGSAVVELVRKEIRRISGHRAEASEILQVMNDSVLRADL